MKKLFYKYFGSALMVLGLFCLSCSNMLDKHPGRGNESDTLIKLPNVFAIDGNAYLTYSISVTLHCGIPGAAMMRFCNEGGAWSAWVPYQTRMAWQIDNRAGLRQVNAEFQKANGDIVACADDIEYVDRITAMSGVPVKHLGWSVSISADGTRVAAGAPGQGKGSAFVYDWNGTSWFAMQLFPADTANGDEFGFSVSLSADGSVAAVSACKQNGERGAVYIFERNYGGTGNWGQLKKITGSDSAAYDKFGWSVSLSKDGNTLIAGAPAHNSEQGAAYIFERNQGGANAWGQSSKISAGGAPQDQFGVSVSVASGNTAVVGAFWCQVGLNTRQGAAYIFERAGGWALNRTLTAGDGAGNDYFGNNVTISGDGGTIVVGSWGDDVDNYGDDRGSAYVFSRGSGWGQTAKLAALDRNNSDRMGCSVAVSDDGSAIAVGSFQDNVGGYYDQGSAYLFELQGAAYVQTRHLFTVEGSIIDRMGVSIAISGTGNAVASGANLDDVDGRIDEGSVYIYR